MVTIVTCPDPDCGAPARIVDRWTWSSTDGPVEHVKTSCERGHWFTPTVDSLDLHSAHSAASLLVPVASQQPAHTGTANPSHVT